MRASATVSAAEVRRLAIVAQGLDRKRSGGSPTRRTVRSTLDDTGMVQLDAINVLERTQFLTLFSRVGAFERRRLLDLCGPQQPLFEYWGRMAAVLPVEHQPLFRWRMDHASPYGNGPRAQQYQHMWQVELADYAEAVFEEVRAHGPLAASQLSDPRRRDGEWWDRRSVGRQALEWLFARGRLTGWRAPSFERVYDVPERVFPPAVLATPTPDPEEAHRRLLVLAAGSLGVGTVADLGGYYAIKTQAARPRVAELVEAGELVEVEVEGWRDHGYARPSVRPRRLSRTHATLLSPFDSLIWERKRTSRIFGFDYTIEVYVPQPKRRYGYFVLPLLLGDELVARFDLKADRKASVLLVRGAFAEPDADLAAVAGAAAGELASMAAWLGLERITVGRRGDLAPALRAAVRSSASVV